MGTRGRRMGEHTRPERERSPEPSLTDKISRAVQSAGKSISETISPTKRSVDPNKEFQELRAEREDLSQPMPNHSPRASQSRKTAPLYSEEEAAQKLRESLAGDSSVVEPEPLRRLSATERRERKIMEREEKRRAWAESNENANNQKKVPSISATVKDRIKEFVEEAKGDAGRIISDSEPKPERRTRNIPDTDSEEEPAAVETPEKVKLYGTGDEYRRDQDGVLYLKDKGSGKWISTGKKSKYGKPKVVDDTSEEDSGESKGSRSSLMRTTGYGNSLGSMSRLGGGGEGKKLDGALSAPSSTISTGVLGRTTLGGSSLGRVPLARGSGYDEEAERKRLESFEAQGSALRVDSSFIRAGSYKKKGGGYSEEKERERLDQIEQAGSPLSAGLGYISAGSYRQKPQAQTGKMDIQSSDIYSTGQFTMKYGNKKPKPVEPEAQIESEMAKLTALQARQAQLTQLQQIQAMQQALQPIQPATAMQQPQQFQPEPQESSGNAMEFLFGIKYGAPVQRPRQAMQPVPETSATAQLFGTQLKKIGSVSTKPSRNATADFFGLKYITDTPKPTKKEPVILGEFGGKRIKHSKQMMDIKVYSPKNKLPETKGGFMGLFEKTKKAKTPNQQKKINATATEFLFKK